jgi:type III secretion protein L
MANITLLDSKRWSLQLSGRRIPREAWVPLAHTEAVVEQANTLWLQTQDECKALREQAYRDGFAAGQAEAMSQMAHHLAEAQRVARDHINGSEQRMIDLAGAIIKRILPDLPYESMLANLVTAALRATRAERYLRVRVHPEAVTAVRTRLDQWRHTFFAVDSLEVGGDASLGLFGCVVESEMGTVHAGFDDQLQALTTVARTAAAEARSNDANAS